MKYIWRKINVGFGVEGTRGTAVEIKHRQPKNDFSFEDKTEVIQDESSIGVITDSRDAYPVKKRAEGELSSNIEVNGIGYLIYALLGGVSTEVDTAGAYKHTFSLLENNQGITLTLGVSDPVIGGLRFPLTSVESLTISAEEWQFATFNVSLKSQSWETQSLTASYWTDNKLLSRHSIFKIAANKAWLGSASSICLKSFEITFTRNLEDDYCLWSVSPRDFINKQFTIEWSFTAVFEEDTYRQYQLDGTKKAISFELKDTWTTIGLSSNPTLKFTLPLVSFTEFSRTQGNDEVVVQTLTFKGLHSKADGESIEAVLVNTESEYIVA